MSTLTDTSLIGNSGAFLIGLPPTAPAPAEGGKLHVPSPGSGPANFRSTEHQAPTIRNESLRLIDWNSFRPDGTLAAIHEVLEHLSQVLGAELWAGLNDSGSWIYASSKPLQHRSDPLSGRLKTAIIEASSQRTASLFALSEKQSSLVLQAARTELDVSFALGFGLDSQNVELGVVLAASARNNILPQDQLSKLLAQVRRELAIWVDVWYLSWLGSKTNSWHARVRKLHKNKRTWVLAVSLLIAAMAIPVPYWPSRECIVEPASRRFLTSPIAGRVIEAQVRPGDLVEPGQLLARIDDEQLRWELANLEADFQKASKKADSALASRSSGDLRMAQLEREQAANHIESLKSKLQQLEIRSPITGVVVDGDWVPTSGTTVERAQTLFEVAPLESMRVRTLLSTEDLGRLTQGTPVTIRVDAAQGDKWAGVVERIDPRGRLEGSEVVFEAETVVQNPQHTLRPGMRGSARLTSGWNSLGWMIFHRPYVWMMKKLAW